MKTKFDVIIIGAGIAGLVAANYLAKNGFSVLLSEQHYVVGGCCSSFFRKGFRFDAGAHSLGGFRKEGIFSIIINDLGLTEKIKVKQAKITDTVITNNFRIDITTNYEETLTNIATIFPNQVDRLNEFLKLVYSLNNSNLLSFAYTYRSLTFADLMNRYFTDKEVKNFFSVFLGNIGAPSTKIKAITGLLICREFVFDGGYYVEGGMQMFVNALANNFKMNGGTVLLKSKVSKIHVKNNAIAGVQINGTDYEVNKVISTIGMQRTYADLMDHKYNDIIDKSKTLKPSLSALIVYLGLNGESGMSKFGRSLWLAPNNDADALYDNLLSDVFVDSRIRLALATSPSIDDKSLAPEGCESVNFFTLAPYKDFKFWDEHKHRIAAQLIDMFRPWLNQVNDRTIVKEIATPFTIEKYTQNQNGAIYGLASTADQVQTSVAPIKTGVKGLYMAGHWSTIGVGQGGAPTSAFTGKIASQMAQAQIA